MFNETNISEDPKDYLKKGVESLEKDLAEQGVEGDPEGFKDRALALTEELNELRQNGGVEEQKMAEELFIQLDKMLAIHAPELHAEMSLGFTETLKKIMLPSDAEETPNFADMNAEQRAEFVESLKTQDAVKRRVEQVQLMAQVFEGLADEVGRGGQGYILWIQRSLGGGDSAEKAEEKLRGRALALQQMPATIHAEPEKTLAFLVPESIEFLNNLPDVIQGAGVEPIRFRETQGQAELDAQRAEVMRILRQAHQGDRAEQIAMEELGPYFKRDAQETRESLSESDYEDIKDSIDRAIYGQIDMEEQAARCGLDSKDYEKCVDAVLIPAAFDEEMLARVRYIKPKGLPSSLEGVWEQYADMHGLGSGDSLSAALDLSDSTKEWMTWAVAEGMPILASVMVGAGAVGVASRVAFSVAKTARAASLLSRLPAVTQGAGAIFLAKTALEAPVSLMTYEAINLFRNEEEFHLEMAAADQSTALMVMNLAAQGLMARVPIPARMKSMLGHEFTEAVTELAAGFTAKTAHVETFHGEGHGDEHEAEGHESISPEGRIFKEMMDKGYYIAAYEFLKSAIRNKSYDGDAATMVKVFGDYFAQEDPSHHGDTEQASIETKHDSAG